VTVTDSNNQTQTAPVNVLVAGADNITVNNVVYTLSKSKLQVASNTDALPKGAATLTGTPMGTSIQITAATNNNPARLTAFGNGFVSGTTPTITISGATGNWTPLNGTFVVKIIDSNTFSVPVDSSKFGPLTGTVFFTQSFGPDVVFTYDPTLDTYNLLADIVQPGPDHVRIRSSYGGVINAPVTKVR